MKRVALIVSCLILASCGFSEYQEKEKQKEVAAVPAKPAESKEDYIKSTSKIGKKGEPVFYKDFLKAPGRYKGQRINITGKVLEIHENSGQSVIQIIVTRNYDSVVAGYPGTIDVYKDDWVTIYGEGAGSVEGKNRMGASISWPAIKATYVVKRKGPQT